MSLSLELSLSLSLSLSSLTHMKRIPVANGKYAASVDDQDYEFLRQHRWHINDGYARTWIPSPTGRYRVYMHRLILEPGEKKVTDHVNRDRLDNRRVNLREVSVAENSRNRNRKRNKNGNFKGTHRRGDKWVAHIRVEGKLRHLGTFPNEEQAARAYDTEALQHFGQFALLNFPLPEPSLAGLRPAA